VARDIQRAVFAQGAEVITIKEMLDAQLADSQVPDDTLKVMLGMGLLVGVFSLGILALRAAVERRRSIGVLRALGYRPGNVLAGILVEVLATTTIGAVVGIAVGLLMGMHVVGPILGPANLRIDGSLLVWTAVLMYLAVLAVTIGPALRAARLSAVEALRVED
jgi:putative ABC transport system permease protein